MTYKQANDVGKERPYGLALCVIGTFGCSDADEFTAEYHRIEGTINAPPFGTFTGYEVQRKRSDALEFVAADATVTLDTETGKLRFIDYTELANGFEYEYRVRGLADDGDTGWSKSATATAIDDAPVASPDGPDSVYRVDTKKVLNVSAAQGVLANDMDHDSPTAYRGRRAELVSGPSAGTLTCPTEGTVGAICQDGSFRYTPPKGGSFTGLVTFIYKANDGLSNDGHSPQVPLSASTQATGTIDVFKK